MSIESYACIAQAIYHAYCKQAGGKTLYGSPLFNYDDLGAEHQACWEAAAREAVAQVAAIRKQPAFARFVDDSVHVSHPNSCTTVYQYQQPETHAPVAPLEQSPVVFSSGGGGDFAGGGASGGYGSSDSSSSSSSSDSGSSGSSE